MQEYPSIPNIEESRKHIGDVCYVFEKLDGSNIRVEWSKKRSWFKFGTRTRLFNETDTDFGVAIPLFLSTYGTDLDNIFRKNKEYREENTFIAFAEFFGPNSFAGVHKKDDPKEVVLFDIAKKSGFISPKILIRDFGHLKIAKLIYHGSLNGQFVADIKEGRYDVVEGVVCKNGEGENRWMVKIKTNDYLQKLKSVFNKDWQKYA